MKDEAVVRPVWDIGRAAIQQCSTESCGKCVPCRVGSQRLKEISARIDADKAVPRDIDTMRILAVHMRDTSACGRGQATGECVLACLDVCGDYLLAHADEAEKRMMAEAAMA